MEPGRFCFFAHGSGKTHFYRSGNTMEILVVGSIVVAPPG